jgi:hypothetical protein
MSFGFIGLIDDGLTVAENNCRKIRILAVGAFDGAGMSDLCAGGAFKRPVLAYGPHIDKVE